MYHARLLVDVDEVLADFQSPALDIIEDLTGTRYKPSDFEIWDMFETFSDAVKKRIFKRIDKRGWCLNLKPFPEAQAAIAEIRSMGVEVFALTSPHHSKSWYYERVEWLKKHYAMPKSHVIQTPAKFLVRGDAFLDDNPSHVEKWRAEHPDKTAMLWHIPNTRTLGLDDIRVRSWDEVKARLEACQRGWNA